MLGTEQGSGATVGGRNLSPCWTPLTGTPAATSAGVSGSDGQGPASSHVIPVGGVPGMSGAHMTMEEVLTRTRTEEMDSSGNKVTTEKINYAKAVKVVSSGCKPDLRNTFMNIM